jgi:uncharacterized membrane protein YkoI
VPAFADDDDLSKMRAIASAAKLITLEDAQAKAIAAKPGTVVDVDLERRFLGKAVRLRIRSHRHRRQRVGSRASMPATGR